MDENFKDALYRVKPERIAPLCKYLLPCGMCDYKKKECDYDFKFISAAKVDYEPLMYTHECVTWK